MFGTILSIGGYLGADIARRKARRGLFRTMLKSGIVRGVGNAEARVALKEGGEELFETIFKRSRKQVARFAKNVTKRGDSFIRKEVRGGGAYRGQMWADDVMGLSGTSVGGTLGSIERSQFVTSIGSELALGVHKYNTLGGIGGVAAMIGMTGIGLSLGGAAGGLANKVPMAPSQEVQNANMYIMPRQAYTQRQRAMQAISMTQLSLRSAFGQEARYMHR